MSSTQNPDIQEISKQRLGDLEGDPNDPTASAFEEAQTRYKVVRDPRYARCFPQSWFSFPMGSIKVVTNNKKYLAFEGGFAYVVKATEINKPDKRFVALKIIKTRDDSNPIDVSNIITPITP